MSASAERPTKTSIEARLIGVSAAIRRVRKRVLSLADLWTPVLVVGEHGSGRDSVVRALHELGVTADFNLITVAPPGMASRAVLERAAAVYLDEIQEHSAEAQAYWAHRLRRAEAKSFAEHPRVFASTSDPLVTDPKSGFNPSLGAYFRRFSIELSPLRERREDIPHLADALAISRGRIVGREVQLTPAAHRRLAAWRWPDNVRQLEELIERMIAFSSGTRIGERVVAEVLSESQECVERIRKEHGWREREELLRVMRETGGNITQTAERLGKSRSAVYRQIQKHGIALGWAREGHLSRR